MFSTAIQEPCHRSATKATQHEHNLDVAVSSAPLVVIHIDASSNELFKNGARAVCVLFKAGLRII